MAGYNIGSYAFLEVPTMLALKVQKVDNSLGLVLPKELVDRLKIKEGDKLFFIEDPDGSYRITVSDPELESQMALAKKGMSRYRNTLHALAK
jgi:putative addiction module antidote